MSNDYQQGLLDGCLLTEDIVTKELVKSCPRKELSERLMKEFGFLKERILSDRLSDIKRQLEML